MFTVTYIRAGQLQCTEGPLNLWRTYLSATLVYTYIKMGGGLNSLEHCYLQTVSYAKSAAEW